MQDAVARFFMPRKPASQEKNRRDLGDF